MKQASHLSEGDTIRIISTARKISKEEIQTAIDTYESWGLTVEVGEYLFEEDHQFAGTEEQRASDLQAALDDEQLKAIVFARGGYGSVQVVGKVDWSKFRSHPKWLVGYSDITVFHAHLNRQLGLESIHAAMPVNIKKDGSGLSQDALESCRKALFGESIEYSFPTSSLNTLTSKVEGELVGGNLSILYNLSGTSSQMDLKDKILFIEDLDEYLYHIDRMFMNLIRSGLLNGCKAVLVGGMSDMNDNTIPYGKTAEEIIVHRLADLGIPICFQVPAGHIHDNRALLLGRKVSVDASSDSVQLKFHERT